MFRIDGYFCNVTDVDILTGKARKHYVRVNFIAELLKVQSSLIESRIAFEEIRLLSVDLSPLLKQAAKLQTDEMGRLLDNMADLIDKMLNVCMRLLKVSGNTRAQQNTEY